MAFYDDHRFLLSHIHHSFITCDDTGMCEMAMLNEVVTDKFQSKDSQQEPEEKILNYYSEAMESELLEAGQSYDVTTGIGFIGGHRHRSNTAQRLERLRKEKQMQAKIAYIQWKEYPNQLSGNEFEKIYFYLILKPYILLQLTIFIHKERHRRTDTFFLYSRILLNKFSTL